VWQSVRQGFDAGYALFLRLFSLFLSGGTQLASY
jgi:hypothetical protein